MNLRGHHVTKENVKNVGKERTWTDQKRVCARPKRGGVGGCSTTFLQKAGSAAAGAPKTSE